MQTGFGIFGHVWTSVKPLFCLNFGVTISLLGSLFRNCQRGIIGGKVMIWPTS